MVEEALSLWFSTIEAKKAIISDAILLEKVNIFHNNWIVQSSQHVMIGWVDLIPDMVFL